MSTTILNEHDANQGAQSKGEFLGMTGNSGWYLLGSAGASVMMVILLWGVLGISLLLCITMGVALCLLSVAYVFTLKNNQPDHYDTDFFASSVADTGAVEMGFSPCWGGKENPVRRGKMQEPAAMSARGGKSATQKTQLRLHRAPLAVGAVSQVSGADGSESSVKGGEKAKQPEPTVTRKVYDNLKAELVEVEDQLAEALNELGEVDHEP